MSETKKETSKEFKEYVTKNIQTINLWIKMKATLQPSMDFLKPIITEFKSFPENKNIVFDGCPECIIDMLRWARKEAKQDEQETKETKEIAAKK